MPVSRLTVNTKMPVGKEKKAVTNMDRLSGLGSRGTFLESP